MLRSLALVAGVLVVLCLPSGLGTPSAEATACRGPTQGARVISHAVGDMDADGLTEQVSVVRYGARALRCQFLLVTRQGTRVRSAALYDERIGAVNPSLVGLAGVARGRGLQAVVETGCCGSYVTGQWLFRETTQGLRKMRVDHSIAPPVGDAFENGYSLCCGLTPVCGSRRGIVLVFGEGRGAKSVDLADVWVQHGNTFRREGRKRFRRPRHDDFGNCRPWIAAS